MNRRAPLRRTARLTTRTPLQRGTGLTTRVPLARTGPLRPRSTKTAHVYVTRRQIVSELFLYPSVCEVAECTVIATDPHEPLTRARGGDILDRANIRLVCHYHNWLFSQSEEPWMYEQGFLIHSWDGGEAA